MQSKKIVISSNAAWNIVNFRIGLVRALEAAGHEVVAVAPPDEFAPVLVAAGIKYVPIEMDKKGLSPVRDLQLAWRYYRILKKLRADVFLGYTPKVNIFGSMAARAAGMKVINNVPGLGTAFIKQGLLTQVVSSLYRLVFPGSSVIFFQNEEDRDLFLRKRLVSAAQARLLPGSGIDLEQFKPVPSAHRSVGGFVFLLVARLLWDKGIGEYVEAARRVRAVLPDTRFQLLGPIAAENRTAVSPDLVKEWISEGVVEHLGTTDDVRPFLAKADCVVLPSYREGLPRTMLEAAAMAKPLIATDVPGCRQVVIHHHNGLLCAVRDADSLAETMLEMARASPALREEWGRAGRVLVEREFDQQMVISRYLQAISEL